MNLKFTQKASYHPKDFEKKRYLADLKLLAPLGEEKAKQYAMLVFTILALSFFGLFAINPTIGTIVELRRKLDDSLLVQQKLTEKIANMTSLQNQFTQIQPSLDSVYDAIPTTPEAPKLLGQLQALAETKQVKIVSLKTLPVPLKADPKSKKQKTDKGDLYYTFTIDTLGSYANLQQFLLSLTKFDRIVNITSVTLNRADLTTSDIEMIVEGQTFYQYEK